VTSFDQGALFFVNHTVVGVQDKLAAIRLTLMVLLPGMDMAVLLEVLGSTRGACLSHDHSALLASFVLVGISGQPYHGIVSPALPV
jgi:hypothetical protein